MAMVSRPKPRQHAGVNHGQELINKGLPVLKWNVIGALFHHAGAIPAFKQGDAGEFHGQWIKRVASGDCISEPPKSDGHDGDEPDFTEHPALGAKAGSGGCLPEPGAYQHQPGRNKNQPGGFGAPGQAGGEE